MTKCSTSNEYNKARFGTSDLINRLDSLKILNTMWLRQKGLNSLVGGACASLTVLLKRPYKQKEVHTYSFFVYTLHAGFILCKAYNENQCWIFWIRKCARKHSDSCALCIFHCSCENVVVWNCRSIHCHWQSCQVCGRIQTSSVN